MTHSPPLCAITYGGSRGRWVRDEADMVKHMMASIRELLGASKPDVRRRDTGMGWTLPKLSLALGLVAIMTAVIWIAPTSGAPASASSPNLTRIEVGTT